MPQIKPFQYHQINDLFDKGTGLLEESWVMTFKGAVIPGVQFNSELVAQTTATALNLGYERGYEDGRSQSNVKQN